MLTSAYADAGGWMLTSAYVDANERVHEPTYTQANTQAWAGALERRGERTGKPGAAVQQSAIFGRKFVPIGATRAGTKIAKLHE